MANFGFSPTGSNRRASASNKRKMISNGSFSQIMRGLIGEFSRARIRSEREH